MLNNKFKKNSIEKCHITELALNTTGLPSERASSETDSPDENN
jgi:hypothetical protein